MQGPLDAIWNKDARMLQRRCCSAMDDVVDRVLKVYQRMSKLHPAQVAESRQKITN
jgi:hypothetical protein